MKIIHLSDLHLGMRFYEFSLIDDQKYILDQILEIIRAQKPDAVCIAGDVYDKSVPPVEAVELFDDFLYNLAKLKVETFIISGNHDSAERLSFGNRIFDVSGLHFSPAYDGAIKPITLRDEYGEVDFYMLPFVKPSNVRRFFPDEKIENYTDAVKVAVNHMQIDGARRNVLIAHQFVTGAKRSESEDISVGGLDNVDASAFGSFDYVALGHIHSPQTAGGERIYYCGTPLKYSFSEVNDQKSVAVIELKEKSAFGLTKIPLAPLHELRELRGTFNELMNRSFYIDTSYQTDYVRITLTDEDDVLNADGNLRVVYHGLATLRYDNTRTRNNQSVAAIGDVENKSPFELFSELYKVQNGKDLSEEQIEYLNNKIAKVWEE